MSEQEGRAYRYFDLIMALFVSVLLISNVASTKIVKLGPLTFDGGTLLFPISYIFGDILTEVYGYRRSRRVIWAGFGAAALMAGILALVGALPPAEGWEYQEAYQALAEGDSRAAKMFAALREKYPDDPLVKLHDP